MQDMQESFISLIVDLSRDQKYLKRANNVLAATDLINSCNDAGMSEKEFCQLLPASVYDAFSDTQKKELKGSINAPFWFIKNKKNKCTKIVYFDTDGELCEHELSPPLDSKDFEAQKGGTMAMYQVLKEQLMKPVVTLDTIRNCLMQQKRMLKGQIRDNQSFYDNNNKNGISPYKKQIAEMDAAIKEMTELHQIRMQGVDAAKNKLLGLKNNLKNLQESNTDIRKKIKSNGDKIKLLEGDLPKISKLLYEYKKIGWKPEEQQKIDNLVNESETNKFTQEDWNLVQEVLNDSSNKLEKETGKFSQLIVLHKKMYKKLVKQKKKTQLLRQKNTEILKEIDQLKKQIDTYDKYVNSNSKKSEVLGKGKYAPLFDDSTCHNHKLNAMKTLIKGLQEDSVIVIKHRKGDVKYRYNKLKHSHNLNSKRKLNGYDQRLLDTMDGLQYIDSTKCIEQFSVNFPTWVPIVGRGGVKEDPVNPLMLKIVRDDIKKDLGEINNLIKEAELIGTHLLDLLEDNADEKVDDREAVIIQMQNRIKRLVERKNNLRIVCGDKKIKEALQKIDEDVSTYKAVINDYKKAYDEQASKREAYNKKFMEMNKLKDKYDTEYRNALQKLNIEKDGINKQLIVLEKSEEKNRSAIASQETALTTMLIRADQLNKRISQYKSQLKGHENNLKLLKEKLIKASEKLQQEQKNESKAQLEHNKLKLSIAKNKEKRNDVENKLEEAKETVEQSLSNINNVFREKQAYGKEINKLMEACELRKKRSRWFPFTKSRVPKLEAEIEQRVYIYNNFAAYCKYKESLGLDKKASYAGFKDYQNRQKFEKRKKDAPAKSDSANSMFEMIQITNENLAERTRTSKTLDTLTTESKELNVNEKKALKTLNSRQDQVKQKEEEVIIALGAVQKEKEQGINTRTKLDEMGEEKFKLDVKINQALTNVTLQVDRTEEKKRIKSRLAELQGQEKKLELSYKKKKDKIKKPMDNSNAPDAFFSKAKAKMKQKLLNRVEDNKKHVSQKNQLDNGNGL